MTDGWQEYFNDKGEPWTGYRTAEAYRQRFVTSSIEALAEALINRRS